MAAPTKITSTGNGNPMAAPYRGDSLSRGHYSSMLCLLQKTIPHNAKSLEQVGQKTVFTAKEYNATIEFYWMPLLLESNADNPGKHRVDDRIVRVGSIHKHAQHWKGVHILVLHSYLWWFKDEYFKILKGGSFEDEVKDVEEVLSKDAYRMGLQSMLEWVKKNVDLTETRVFFTGMSPTHGRSVEWGGERNGSCYNETSMVHDLNYEGPKSWKKTERWTHIYIQETMGAFESRTTCQSWALWTSVIGASFAYSTAKTPLKPSLRLIHARMHAQALTLAAISGAAVYHHFQNRGGDNPTRSGD
ncbi:unnamed protein product [Cuscuta campestris]|uniref:HIG1 domain-containing protein n=1 Tax=Cuscuta campestris TaxID=132261 RepID=A0A484MP51_9ASTE|nr:unnamed protein product [Cuscuta campestris]